MPATGSPIPWIKLQVFDNNGEPAAGKYLFTYEAGTSTKITTYSEFDLSVSNSNPIVLDSAGRATVYLTPNTYKFVLTNDTDTDPPTSPIWTQDQVPSLSPFASNLDLLGTAGETIVTGNAVYLSGGDGGTTAGRWYKTDADQTYSSNAATTVGFAVSGASAGSEFSIRKNGKVTGLSGLVAGTVYYASATAGALTSTAPTNAIVLGKADTTTSLVLGASWGDASATVTGLISAGTQTFGGVKTFAVQPLANIGTSSTPGTVGGVYFTDIAVHAVVAGQTDSIMSTTTIPANMLNADGKAIWISLGTSTATTGANAKTIELLIGATQVAIRTSNTNDASWSARALLIRKTSSTADLAFFGAGVSTGVTNGVTALTGLDFTAAITVASQATTGAVSTFTQTYFTVEAVG